MLNNKIRSLNYPNQNVQNYTEYIKINSNNTVKIVKQGKENQEKKIV